MLKEVLNGKVRNHEIEKIAIEQFLIKTNGCVNRFELEETLKKNCYNGMYLLSSNEFHLVEPKTSICGLYESDYNVIILDEEEYNDENDIAVHELVHAYLNKGINKTITIDHNTVEYGYGLEEGVASIMEKIETIDDIDNCITTSYPYQANLLKQLNILYGYNKNKKYSNLLQHILKEPDTFLHLIPEIYENILRNTLGNDSGVSSMSLRSAFAIVSMTDIMITNDEADSRRLYQLCSAINTIYLALADQKMRDGDSTHFLFPDLNQIVKTREQRLLNLIFNNEMGYFEDINKRLTALLAMSVTEIEHIENNKKNDGYAKVKKI